MTKTVELLAPAGSYEGLVAAINAGADAVYIGGQKFGARAYADNPEQESLIKGIDYAHLYGKKVHMTINTLLKEKELEQELYPYLLPFYEAGLDAVIVQDVGVASFIKENFPNLPIHASTQMTLTGELGAKFWEEQGVERVVLARELSLREVEHICKNVNIEVECFVHGAICYCYSGQCLFSSFLGGRSGNRGRCAQPCRLPYQAYEENRPIYGKEELYPLSLKDMMTVSYLPELIDAGITSFKIEGRMKRMEYGAGVVAIYRKYIDLYLKDPDNFHVEKKDLEQLLNLYSRSGNSQGYYKQHNGKDMLSLNNPAYRMGGEETFELIKERYCKGVKQKKISGKLKVFEGENLEIWVTMGAYQVHVTGNRVDSAKNQPMSKEKIEKQMKKTGGTLFQFEELQIELKGNVFVPVQWLNELRREALDALQAKILAEYARTGKEMNPHISSKVSEKKTDKPAAYKLHVSVETQEQLDAVLGEKAENLQAIYLDCSIFSLKNEKEYIDQLKRVLHSRIPQNLDVYFMLPVIFRENTKRKFDQISKELLQLGFTGMVVRNYEELQWLKMADYSRKIITEFNMYVFNQRAKEFYLQNGVHQITYPLELNVYEMKDLNLEQGILCVYGHIPFMTTAQCINRTFHGCDHSSGKRITLKDRYKKDFIATNYCDYCYNVIRNGIPLSFLGARKQVDMINCENLRLMFTTETRKKTAQILEAFSKSVWENEEKLLQEFTRGHMKKGVE